MDFRKELETCIRARFALIVVATLEEERAEDIIKGVCESRNRPSLTWDLADGFKALGKYKSAIPSHRDPLEALEFVAQEESDSIFVFRDFHDCWKNSQVKRKLRSLARELKYTRKSILVISPSAVIPDELRNLAVVIDLPPPSVDDLEQALSVISETPDVEINLDDDERRKLIEAARGLTTAQALRVFAKAVVRNGILDEDDVHIIAEHKREVIRQSEALEFQAVNLSIEDIGGLAAIKDWLRTRGRALSQDAVEYGLPPPKGIALIGIPGTGKSLTAKLVGSMWGLPLLRLDVGALFGSYVGESEERARRALRLAEAVAPCVVWIDEMEKALAHGGNDSGTSTRVFGTILTWMQEKQAPCFVVATANSIDSLPPELLRRGRFDEIFFLDLPNPDERTAIFEVHLKKRGRKPEAFDIKSIVKHSEGYVGAEIEQSVIDAMYLGFDDTREFTTEDILTALKRLVPLSVSQRETISRLRSWLEEGRARSAS